MTRIFLISLLAITFGFTVFASQIDPKSVYPCFQIGVTGINATIEKGLLVTVESTDPDSPGMGKVLKGDVIVTAGGKTVGGDDPRVPLGEAVGAAEATDGRLAFTVRRGGSDVEVAVTIPVLGPYSKTWPLNCKKSDTIIRETAEFIVKNQQPNGGYKFGRETDRDSVWTCLDGLFLLSTGNDKYLPSVRLQAKAIADQALIRPNGSTWHLGYEGILLGEYYLRTGDASVLPGLKAICGFVIKMQAAGSWGHGNGPPNSGYVQSGLMNSAAVPVFTALTLARECGVELDEAAYQRSLVFFYRFTGHGSVCYGDHRAEIYPNTNGRNDMMACAFTLLDGQCYQMAAKHLALIDADSYYAHEIGHTGGGFNVIWRGIGTVLLPPEFISHYRRQMDVLAWYYDLCRVHGGGFSILPSPPNEKDYGGVMWGTGAVALTYTAPLKTLRITGAPHTKFSVKTKEPASPWGNAADLTFLRMDNCEGFGAETLDPGQIYDLLNGKAKNRASVEFCSKMMRHQNPMFRTWAARRLSEMTDPAAMKELAVALDHSDPRVRRAALDGISDYDNWIRPFSSKIPSTVVSAKFLPAIERILKNRESAIWEVDGALFALGRAEPSDIRKNMDIIQKYTRDDEWYLREGAFWALVGLHKSITPIEFKRLAEMYSIEKHVYPRDSYDQGFRQLLKSDKVTMSPEDESAVVKIIGRTFNDPPYMADYGPPARDEVAHRTMMILSQFNHKDFAYVVDDLKKYLATWTPDHAHSIWMLSGSPWQPGILKVFQELGKDGGPLAPGLADCVEKRLNPKTKDQIECRQRVEAALREFEAKFK